MRRRRRIRRWMRADVVAPWLAMSVVLLLWWAAASSFAWMRSGREQLLLPVREEIDLDVPRREPLDHIPPLPVVKAPPPGPIIEPHTSISNADIAELRSRSLRIPVRGVDSDDLVSSFFDKRGRDRRHEAIDILAPRGTEVLAVEDGPVARLFMSAAGGLTVYQFDSSRRFVYYYAHLDRYAPALREGAALARGDVIGYVGSTGNAPADTPHLHFAISKLDPDGRWWGGAALDPFLVWRDEED